MTNLLEPAETRRLFIAAPSTSIVAKANRLSGSTPRKGALTAGYADHPSNPLRRCPLTVASGERTHGLQPRDLTNGEVGSTKVETRYLPTRRALFTALLGAGVAGMLPRIAPAAGIKASHAIAFDGGAILFASDTLAISGDAGRSWSSRMPPGRILALATHRDRPDRVVAGLAEGGVGISADGGTTWRVEKGGLSGGEVNAVTIASRTPDTLYAAVRGDGLYKSDDAGESWSLAMDRPWIDKAKRDPLTLASVDLETGMGGIWIYAGTEVGLTRVPDCFCRWQDVQPGNAMDALATGAAPPPTNSLPYNQPVLSLACSPSMPAKLYAALPSGLWVSQDAGVAWEQKTKGVASAVAASPEDADYIAAFIDGKLKLSGDGGTTWTATAAG